jgi:hypothetical protein
MKVMFKQTKLSSEEVIERAKNYFENEIGLKMIGETANCCVEFASNLGFVLVEFQDEDKNQKVVLTTREYDYQIQEFLRKI